MNNKAFQWVLLLIITQSSFAAQNIVRGLVSYYPFSSNFSDFSGNGNHCTNFGASLTEDRFGSPNSAYSFQNPSYMQCPIDRATFQSSFTITAWIQNLGPCNFCGIISNNAEICYGAALTMRNNTTMAGIYQVCSVDNGMNSVFTDLSSSCFNNWVFLALTRTANVFTVYSNMTQKNSGQLTQILNNTDKILIGKLHSGSSNTFNGKIDDVRIQNRVLSQQELFYLYLDDTPRQKQLSEGLQSYYPFQQDATDLSGNGNDCTFNNASLNFDRFNNSNSSFNFDGSSTQMQCPISNPPWLGNWTITAWIYHRAASSQGGIFSNNQMVTSAALISSWGTSTKIGMHQIGDPNNGMWIDANQIHYDRWCFVALTRNKSTQTMYFWIQQWSMTSNEVNISWTLQSSNQIYIGRTQDSQLEIFYGMIDDVRIQNRALSLGEVKALICWPNKYYYSLNATCLANCPEGYFINFGECTKCHYNCWKCEQAANKCTICFQGFVLVNSTCVSNSPGLVSFQPFIGDANDQSGNENNCTNYGATLTQDRFASPNNAQKFDGASSYLECPISASAFSNQWTIVAWFSQSSKTTWPAIISNSVNINSAPGIIFNTNNSIGMQEIGASPENANGTQIDLGPNITNKWIFVVLKYTQNMLKLNAFLEGYYHQQNESFINWTLKSSNKIYIGRTQQLYYQIFNGIIDGVRIYNTSLPQSDIFELFCSTSKMFYPDNQTCLSTCPEGYFANRSQCEKCDNICKACNLVANNCTSCNISYFLQNMSCYKDCPADTYIDNSTCKICDFSKCKTCLNASNICTGCPANKYLQNNSCFDNCPESFFGNSANICQKCNILCKNCDILEDNCTSCPENRVWYKYTCLSDCPPEQFSNGSICNSCNPICKSCYNDSSNCLECKENLGFLNGTCQVNCPPGQFVNQSNCSLCNSSACKYCIESQNNCTACNANLILVQNACILNCQKNYQINYSSKKCELCQANCQSCNTQNLCKECIPRQAINWLDSTHNVCERPYCLTNEQRINGTCVACPDKCKTCISNESCLSCFENYGLNASSDAKILCIGCKNSEIWTNSLCVLLCLQGQFLQKTENKCINCTEPCFECLNEFSCQSCKPKQYLNIDTKQCLDACPEAYVIENDTANLYCSKCQIDGCIKCASIIQCKQCNSTLFLQNGQCIFKCPSSTIPNNLNECVSSIRTSDIETQIDLFTSNFTNALLYILSHDENNNTFTKGQWYFTQESSFYLINQIVTISDYFNSSILEESMKNSMIDGIIDSAINMSVANILNYSIQDVIDNQDNLESLCEATKLKELSSNTNACVNIVNNFKNEKMTIAQSKGLIDLIVLTAKPRIRKLINNSTSFDPLYSSAERDELFSSLNIASNTLCIRNPSILTSVNYTQSSVDVVFKNTTTRSISIVHPQSYENITINTTNMQNSVIKSMELDPVLEVVPKSNESFLSMVINMQLLKFCSSNMSNEEQPTLDVNESELTISINFSLLSGKLDSSSNFYCAFLSFQNANIVNNNLSTWEILGSPIVDKTNNMYICNDQHKFGFQAVLQGNQSDQFLKKEESNSLVLIISLSVGGAVIGGLAIFGIWWWIKSKNQKQIHIGTEGKKLANKKSKAIANKTKSSSKKIKNKNKKT